MKVVVGVDGSDLANHAVQFMNRLLTPKVDDLVLYFSPPEFHLASKTPIAEGVLKDASQALADAVFNAATHYLSPEMRSVTSMVAGEELASTGLIELAEKENADLLVVGSKNAARKFPYFLGSTARTVIHHSGRPMLVGRGGFKTPDEPLRIVIACDENRWCDATNLLRDFSWPEGTTATLFHVTESLGDDFVDSLLTHGSARIPNSVQMVEEYRVATQRRMDAFADRLKRLQQTGPSLVKNAKVEVAQGAVVDKIIAKVESENADLLVVSSRKLGTLGRLLGSVTESLLTRCPCSLLIVHDKELDSSQQDETHEN